MAIFITIAYGSREGYDRADAVIRDAAHAHDTRLRAQGVLMGIAATPVQVRNPDAKPCAVAHGVVEVWPLNQTA